MNGGATRGIEDGKRRCTAGPARALTTVLLTAGLLSGCQAVQTPQSADVIAMQPARCADQVRQPAASGVAFRADADWQAHLAGLGGELRRSLWDWRVDFSAGESVALVSAGPQPNPGYRVTVAQDTLPVREQVLEVKVVVVPPPGHMMQAQVISFPCVYLKLAGAAYREVAVEVARQ
jgi:hypothetical protein